jgi:hypothetical protein
MKPVWVLTEEEKLERKSKMSKKSPVVRVMQEASEPPAGDRFSAREADELTRYADAISRTKAAVPMPETIRFNLLRMMKSGEPMTPDGIVEFFTLVYSRMADFALSVAEFRTLSDHDKRQLLSRNLDVVANVYLARCFRAGGYGHLETQLGEIHVHPEEYDALRPVHLGQLFVRPWCKGHQHFWAYAKMMSRLCANCVGDRDDLITWLLFQLVALFHNDDLSLTDKAGVSRAQEHFAGLLLKRLRHVSASGPHEAHVRFANLVELLHDLRRLADILTDKA